MGRSEEACAGVVAEICDPMNEGECVLVVPKLGVVKRFMVGGGSGGVGGDNQRNRAIQLIYLFPALPSSSTSFYPRDILVRLMRQCEMEPTQIWLVSDVKNIHTTFTRDYSLLQFVVFSFRIAEL